LAYIPRFTVISTRRMLRFFNDLMTQLVQFIRLMVIGCVQFILSVLKVPLDPLRAIPVIGCSVACLFCFACWVLWLIPFLGWLLAFPAGFVGFIGNGLAAIYMYKQATLLTQLDRLAKENGLLAKALGNMQANNDELSNELHNLTQIRESLQKYADDNNQSIAEIMEQSCTMFEKIKDLTQDNNRTLLMRIAQDLEFMDSEADFSPEEFERFIQRIPKQLQQNVTKMQPTFQNVDSNKDNLISFKEIQNFVEELLAVVDADTESTECCKYFLPPWKPGTRFDAANISCH